MDDLAVALEILAKVLDGHLTNAPIRRTRRPGRGAYAGGTSEIVRHHNAHGYQIATSHRITMPSGGSPVHWHVKAIRMGDVVLVAP